MFFHHCPIFSKFGLFGIDDVFLFLVVLFMAWLLVVECHQIVELRVVLVRVQLAVKHEDAVDVVDVSRNHPHLNRLLQLHLFQNTRFPLIRVEKNLVNLAVKSLYLLIVLNCLRHLLIHDLTRLYLIGLAKFLKLVVFKFIEQLLAV